jgi:anti-sigma factor ChrR (cupin superfamily)
MLKCKEVTRLLASDEYLESRWGRRLAIRMHLVMCQHCRRYARQLRAIRNVASSLWKLSPSDRSTLEQLERRIWVAWGGFPPSGDRSTGPIN